LAASTTSSNVSTTTANYLDGITAPPGWTITRWAVGGAGVYWNPDSIEVDGNHVWVGYQNTTAKDGSDIKTSTIVEYSMDGTVIKTWPVPGHNDGLRIDPTTHLVWATSNEDGSPRLNIIDPTSGSVTPYTFANGPRRLLRRHGVFQWRGLHRLFESHGQRRWSERLSRD
jgi:hypothetical protein